MPENSKFSLQSHICAGRFRTSFPWTPVISSLGALMPVFGKPFFIFFVVRRGSVMVRRGSVMVRRGSVMVWRGSDVVRRGSAMVRRDSVMVRRGSVMVRRGSVGSASACWKAGPSSIPGSAPQGGLSHRAISDEEMERGLGECIVWLWLDDCM